MLNAPTQIWPGSRAPLGATFDGSGTNFALYSAVATKVELCLFDREGNENRIELTEVDNDVWHCYLPGIAPWSSVWLPRLRPLRSCQWAPLRSQQATAGPLCQSH